MERCIAASEWLIGSTEWLIITSEILSCTLEWCIVTTDWHHCSRMTVFWSDLLVHLSYSSLLQRDLIILWSKVLNDHFSEQLKDTLRLWEVHWSNVLVLTAITALEWLNSLWSNLTELQRRLLLQDLMMPWSNVFILLRDISLLLSYLWLLCRDLLKLEWASSWCYSVISSYFRVIYLFWEQQVSAQDRLIVVSCFSGCFKYYLKFQDVFSPEPFP